MERPFGSAGAGVSVLSSVLPATVLEVCAPWPKPGFASGVGPLQMPPVLVLQSAASSLGLPGLKPQAASFANDGWSALVPPSRTAATMPWPSVPVLFGVAVPSQIL